MSPNRPRFPKTDSNHKIVREVLSALDYRYGGCDFKLIDTSTVGKNLTDWLLICEGRTHYIEVKVPEERDSLTVGEAETKSWGVPFYVVTTKEEVVDLLRDISLEFEWRGREEDFRGR